MAALDPVEIVWRAHLNYFVRFIERGGGRVLDADGVALWSSVHGFPGMVNSGARVDPRVDPNALFDRAEEFFGTKPHDLLALDDIDDDVIAAARSRGFRVGDPSPLQLLRDAPRVDAGLPTGVALVVVTDARGVADIASVNRDATRVYGFPEDVFPTLFAREETVLADDIIAVIAYEDGTPVGTAQVMVDGNAAYVGWVAVVPDQMRRGIATVVTADVIRRGYKAGAELAVLSASPMGAPVYRRMGFVDVGTTRSLVPPTNATS